MSNTAALVWIAEHAFGLSIAYLSGIITMLCVWAIVDTRKPKGGP